MNIFRDIVLRILIWTSWLLLLIYFYELRRLGNFISETTIILYFWCILEFEKHNFVKSNNDITDIGKVRTKHFRPFLFWSTVRLTFISEYSSHNLHENYNSITTKKKESSLDPFSFLFRTTNYRIAFIEEARKLFISRTIRYVAFENFLLRCSVMDLRAVSRHYH